MKVTVLAPAYNEEESIERFVSAVADRLEDGWEIVVVDDGSSDTTPERLSELSARYPALRVITHAHNRGIGAALATGFVAIGDGVIVTMDADLSHPLDLLGALVEGCASADACFGSRFVPGGGMVGVPLWRRAVSKVANVILRTLYGSTVRDLTTGYRAYRAGVVHDLDLIGSGFETQLEITIRLLAAGRTIHEVPLMLKNRVGGESKMRYVRLIPAYASMTFRLFGLRWLRKRGGAT
ncbi:MAG: glycosyltransferase [Acidimicrobiia bacterium]